MGFGSSCDSHHNLLLVVINVLQRYKTNFSTLIGWYIINIISVNEITVFTCTFKLKLYILQIVFLKCTVYFTIGWVTSVSA